MRRKNIKQPDPGFDPEFVFDGLTIAGFHIERGARSFGAYAEAMIAELGDTVRPYLKFFYNGIRDFPGFDFAKEMDPPGLVDLKAAKWATSPGSSGQRPLSTGDAVVFTTREGDTIHGHLLQRQGRRRLATVIDAEKRVWKVSEEVLKLSDTPPLSTILTPYDETRAAWSVGDRVAFSHADGLERGEIVKLNPKRAKVRCQGGVWNVPYGLLQRVGRTGTRDGAQRLKEVAGVARGLMDEHGLADWKLAFVESRKRLGDCDYRERVIRIGRPHALTGKDESIRDTVLHEIAHALAGPGTHHGPEWKAIAQRIGATPRARSYEKG